MQYFKHSKFSTPLIELLTPKLSRDEIGAALHFLGWLQLLLKNDLDKKEYEGHHVIEVYSPQIRDYLGNKYSHILDTLIELELLIRNNYYVTKQNDERGEGKCREYGLTQKAKEQLASPSRQYLNFIATDKAIQGKVRRSIQKRGLQKQAFDCVTVKYAVQTILDVSFNHDLMKSILDKMPKDKQTANTHVLIQIVEKKYKELKKHEGTGRVFNPLNMISAQIRKGLEINGRKFARSIDMRACHMTFLADYIQDHCTKIDLTEEVVKYRSILCDEEKHPKDYFAQELNISPDDVKKMLNTTLNGGNEKGTKAWFRWFQREFPGLYGQWDRTEDKIRETGVNISRHYESKIFRADFVVKLANDCKVTVIDAHDALFIYGDPDNAAKYARILKAEARALAGFNLQFGEDEFGPGVYNPKKDYEALKVKIATAEVKKDWVRVDELKQDLARFKADNCLMEH